MKQINLDDPNIYKQLDPQNMLRHIQDVPALCRRAWKQALSMDLPPGYSRVNRIAILGMGGSAIGGDLLSGLILGEAPVPISVHRSYTLPAFVNEDTLVIASSYSGMTEETLSAFQQALKGNTRIMVMTTGGRVKQLAAEHNLPVFEFDYRSPPRAALYLSFIALVGITQKIGFIGDKGADIEESSALLDRLEQNLGTDIPLASNPAKQMAKALFGKMAIIYGAGFLTEVAHRWKAQINENAKTWSFYGALPEINHNAVSGYRFPAAINSKTLAVMLCSPLLHERVKQRYPITADIMKQAGIEYLEVNASGRGPLSQMLELMLLGDFVSYYLAMLNNVDPYPIEAVDFLKAELAKNC